MWGCRQYMRFKPSISFKPYPLYYPHKPSMAGVQLPGHGQVLACGLFGTGPHRRRWWGVFTATPHHSYYPLTSCQISGGIRFSEQHEPYWGLCLRGTWAAGSSWESSPKYPPLLPPLGPWKNCLPQTWSLMPKSLWPLIYAIFCFLMRAKPSGWHGVINQWLNLICSVL